MQHILRKISDMKDTEVDILYNLLKSKLETSTDDGFSYSDIAQFVFISKSDDIEYLLKNLDSLKQISKSRNDDIVKEGINKIKNHIGLEVCRLNYLEKKQKEDLMNITSGTLTDVQSMNDKLKDYDEKFQKNNKEISNWYANIVTILGLFAAIVVTFFGGIGSINSIFNSIDSISKYRLIFIILMVMFAMFNIVFMLLYYISLITNKSINKECANSCDDFKSNFNSSEGLRNRTIREGTSCANKKLTCSRKRYPLVMAFNFAILFMMIVLIVFYLFKV